VVLDLVFLLFLHDYGNCSYKLKGKKKGKNPNSMATLMIQIRETSFDKQILSAFLSHDRNKFSCTRMCTCLLLTGKCIISEVLCIAPRRTYRSCIAFIAHSIAYTACIMLLSRYEFQKYRLLAKSQTSERREHSGLHRYPSGKSS
jgi:hypothetical protein